MLRPFTRASGLSAVFIAALFVAGCGGGGRPSTADENKGGDTKPKKDQLPPKDGQSPISPKGNDLRLVKPDFTLTSSELGAEYQNNFTTTREKYKGKVIELSGVVRWIRRDPSDRVLLWLVGATKSPVDLLKCVTRDSMPWKQVTPGQTVNIKGKSPDPDYDGQIALLDCAIVEATGPPAPSFTADQVGREYRADPVGFTKKYDENSLILSGEIARTDFQEGALPSAVLKTPEGQPRVVCHFGNLPEKEVRQLKRGQKIRVLCESGINETRDEANLSVYLLMEMTD